MWRQDGTTDLHVSSSSLTGIDRRPVSFGTSADVHEEPLSFGDLCQSHPRMFWGLLGEGHKSALSSPSLPLPTDRSGGYLKRQNRVLLSIVSTALSSSQVGRPAVIPRGIVFDVDRLVP